MAKDSPTVCISGREGESIYSFEIYSNQEIWEADQVKDPIVTPTYDTRNSKRKIKINTLPVIDHLLQNKNRKCLLNIPSAKPADSFPSQDVELE